MFKFINIIAVLLFTSNLFAEQKIHLLRVNYPPLWVNSGPLKGQGFADAGEAFLIDQFKQFSFVSINSNVARAQSLMVHTRKETYCAVPHGKGFFNNVVESKVWVATAGHVLTAKQTFIAKLKNDPNIINGDGQLILKAFLKNYDAKGVIVKGQRYPVIDELLHPYLDKRIVQSTATNMLTPQRMVLQNRADYTFQYESSVRYLQKIDQEVAYISLQELNSYSVPIVIGCNDTPLANLFLKQVDNNIQQLREVGLQKMQEYHSEVTFKLLQNIADY